MEAVSSVTSVQFTFPVSSFQWACLDQLSLTLQRQAIPFEKHQRHDQEQLWAEEEVVTALCYPANCHPPFSINEDKSKEIVSRNI